MIVMRLFLMIVMMMVSTSAMAQNRAEDKSFLSRSMDEQSVIEYLKQSEKHTLFVNALRATGMDVELDKNESWTVFAPIDSAFAKLPRARVYAMFAPKNANHLRRFVKHHIQRNGLLITQSMPVGASRFIVANGQEVVIAKTPSGVTVNNTYIFQPDIRVRNGIVHNIDSVLLISDTQQ